MCIIFFYQSSWVTEVRNLLCNCGFAELWYNQGVGYNEDFLKIVTQRKYDIYGQDWSAKLHESPSARIVMQIVHLIAKYVHKAFDLRQNYVNNQVR